MSVCVQEIERGKEKEREERIITIQIFSSDILKLDLDARKHTKSHFSNNFVQSSPPHPISQIILKKRMGTHIKSWTAVYFQLLSEKVNIENSL